MPSIGIGRDGCSAQPPASGSGGDNPPVRRGYLWRCSLVSALLICAAVPPTAAAAEPLGLSDCEAMRGLQVCSGLVPTWDGVPLDTTVTLPAPAARKLPLVVEIHGFGNSKYEYLDPASAAYTDNAFAWARRGYAVLTYTARGLWGSCGTPDSRLGNPAACARGYIHLADTRYEVRDTQTLIGRLVDEGIADPGRIGVTGDSYGGGQSMALAALSDRMMLPDGRLVAWRSPGGTRLRIAAAAPVIPWTDLVGAIAPNGRELSYAIGPLGEASDPVGVFKASFANALFAAAQFATGPGQPVGEPFVPGRPMGFLAPRGLDPDADVTAWVARADAGEPYDDAEAKQIVRTLQRFHSAIHIDASHRPPPLFVASGFTDDLFPVAEALRYVNRTSRRYPRLPLTLFLGDFGHQRAANKERQRAHLIRSIHRWFDHHLLGRGRRPYEGAIVYTQTCPQEARTPGADPRIGVCRRGPGRGTPLRSPAPDDLLDGRRSRSRSRDRPRRRRRQRLRDGAGRPRARHRCLRAGGPPSPLHAARRADDDRQPRGARRAGGAGPGSRPAMGRGAGRDPDPRRPRPLSPPARAQRLATAPRRVEVRPGSRRQARAARCGPAVRAPVER